MLKVLDLPKYLSEHGGKMSRVFLACVFNKQVDMPEHLRIVNSNKDMKAVLVDVLGVAFGSEEFKNCEKYVVKGEVLVVLGPRAFAPSPYGKSVFCLQSDAVLREGNLNYVEFVSVYGDKLYATATKAKDMKLLRSDYKEFGELFDTLGKYGWDLEKFFDDYSYPNNYRVCGSGIEFKDVSGDEKFVFKSEEEYKRSQVAYTSNPYAQTKKEYGKSDDTLDNLNKKQIDLSTRTDIVEKPTNFYVIKKSVDVAENKIRNRINELGKNEKDVNIDDLIEVLYRNLKMYWYSAPSSYSATGRAIFKNTLEHIYPEFKIKYENNKPLIDNAIDVNNLLGVWYTGMIPEKVINNPFYILVANAREEIYIGVIDYLLGLRKHLINAYNYSRALNINFMSLLMTNPYYLSLIDNRLSVEDLDKLAMLYKVEMTNIMVLRIRNAAYMHNIMQDINNKDIKENTIIKKSVLCENAFMGFIISSKSYSNLNTYGTVISERVFENLRNYIKSDINKEDFALPISGWGSSKVHGITKYILPFEKKLDNEQVVNDYILLGLGVEVILDNTLYVMDYNYALKEMYIIERLYELQEQGDKPKLDNDSVEKCIRGFERIKALEWNMPDFKLEEKQVDAVKMLYNPIMCLTGPAGSGKTTTAEAILFALQALFGIDENNIMFAAPTGKAANRLKEIVKKPTRTINSLFSIGNESYTLIDEKDVKKKSEIQVLIVDESSMINIELMYNMIRKIDDKTRIIFMGDREQLPPIGAGKPFSNLLTFLPCVVLDVTKRAEKDSGITQNAESIIYQSDVLYPDVLKVYDDFRIIDAPISDIEKLVVGIVNYHLGGAGEKRAKGTRAGDRVLQSLGVNMNPDDIQVITPVNKYKWGTKNLNPLLQDVFNPVNIRKRRIRFENTVYESLDNSGNKVDVPLYSEFRIGDRVINTENMASAERYLQRGVNTYQKISNTSGVMNGDIGKIAEFVLGSELHFIDKDGAEDEAVKKEFSDESNVLYVAVKYQDVDENSMPLDFIIFYKTDLVDTLENQKVISSENIYTINSYNLSKLDLAYALNVHKIQGSQAKLVIFVLYPVGYEDFISRNLIYTGMTRAEEGIYLVGNVWSSGNVLQRGRKIEQNRLRTTIADKIFENKM